MSGFPISHNIDIAVECIKAIVETNRCKNCNTSSGLRERYSCGHVACADCVAVTNNCLLCVTPPDSSTPKQPRPDDPSTQRANNALALLKSYQETFNIDVYKRNRISEQLKIEKEVFPECIQAPIKYTNKRKSSTVSLENKENRRHSFFPGEQISPIDKSKSEMEKSNYVQKWLDQSKVSKKKLSESSFRQPFTDLNVNSETLLRKERTPIKKQAKIILDQVNEISKNATKNKKAYRKRSHVNTTVGSLSPLDKFLKPVEKGDSYGWSTKKIKKGFDDYDDNKKKDTNNQDESGVEVIIVDDSQSEVVDKDKLAWLAVLGASEKESSSFAPAVRLECSEVVKYTDNIEKTLPSVDSRRLGQCDESKVPFYKQSSILETCILCRDDVNKNNNGQQAADASNEVSVTIESSSFMTTIKISKTAPNSNKIPIDKHSISVQTDINLMGLDKFIGPEVCEEKTDLLDSKHSNKLVSEEYNEYFLKKCSVNGTYVQSHDLFTCEAKNDPEKRNSHGTNILNESKQESEMQSDTLNSAKNLVIAKEPKKQNDAPNVVKNLVIADSDSDNDANDSKLIQVTAEVHRSSEQLDCSVLAELEHQEVRQRRARVRRNHTPTSTDSSDKENHDPNRAKRMKPGKKCVQKKGNKNDNNASELNSIYIFNE